jgi:tetratricopeptide (TPR) repeat protein/transcriptional regulator with XRE-family HTH domain
VADEDFGGWLRRSRRAAGLTQEELSARSGLSVRTISDLERGRTGRPHPRSVRLLATALGLPGEQGADMVTRQRARREADPSPTAPHQLPLAIRHFAGRIGALKALSGLLMQSTRTGGAAVISSIGGTAGIGKTALAVHWAHQHADRFPDGQLYVNLRGFSPSDAPLSPGSALRGFLDGLGVPAARIPLDLDAQVALYRSRIAGRRVLIVLDNARDAAQVRPLLPGSAGCLTLVTSRDRLTGLVAAEGAVPVELDLLGLDESRELLERRLGPERVAVEREAAAEVIDLCAGLPLALNIVAAYTAAYPDLSLDAAAGGLRGARQLDLLATGDLAADVRAVFSWSYRALEAVPAHAFRLLGLAPGPDIGPSAAAALMDLTTERAAAVLGALVDVGLLQTPSPGRYRLHELLRTYAVERAAADEPTEARDADVSRLLAWYLATTLEAARVISPDRRRPPLAEDSPTPLGFASYDAAFGWLDLEYANLVAAIETAWRRGERKVVWKLAVALWDVFNLKGHFADLIATHRRALESVRLLGDRDAEAWLLSHLSVAYSTIGSAEEAVGCLRRALEIDRETGNRRSEAVNLVNLGFAYVNQASYEQAVEAFEAAVHAARETGHWRAEAAALNNVGAAYKHLGRLDEALEHTEAALEIHRERDDRAAQAASYASMAEIRRLRGEPAESFRLCELAIGLARETGNRREEADALTTLGYLHLAAGAAASAAEPWLAAEAIFAEIGDPRVAELAEQLAALG